VEFDLVDPIPERGTVRGKGKDPFQRGVGAERAGIQRMMEFQETPGA